MRSLPMKNISDAEIVMGKCHCYHAIPAVSCGVDILVIAYQVEKWGSSELLAEQHGGLSERQCANGGAHSIREESRGDLGACSETQGCADDRREGRESTGTAGKEAMNAHSAAARSLSWLGSVSSVRTVVW